jgi:hypothetical protein
VACLLFAPLTMPASTRPIASPEHSWGSSPGRSAPARASQSTREDRARTRRTADRPHAAGAARAARRRCARVRDVAAFARRGRPARSRALARPTRLARPAGRRAGARPPTAPSWHRLRRESPHRAAESPACARPVLADLRGVHVNTAHQMGRAGWPPPGELPDAPPRRMMVTAARLPYRWRRQEVPGLTGGAAEVGQARAGARSRRAPAPPSSWVCRSAPCGRPAQRAAARPARPAGSTSPQKTRPLQAAALAGARAMRRCARCPVSMVASPAWYSGRARNPRRARGRRDYLGLATARSLRVEHRAEAGSASPPRCVPACAADQSLGLNSRMPASRPPDDRYAPRTLWEATGIGRNALPSELKLLICVGRPPCGSW